MNDTYKLLHNEVELLCTTAIMKRDKIFRKPGWNNRRAVVNRAIDSGLTAWYDKEPNYARLEIARRELLEIL